ncbi:methyltransferase domain-containing protein [Streptomyces spectabilis]|uniref:methyltransferase domain-containing protein n=1 Tax=Streptomyces spectabilis TaxID=68270 RepID=UPI001377F1B1|nr:methyltransferase domain-containing protein [Streptomyces spectabilis]
MSAPAAAADFTVLRANCAQQLDEQGYFAGAAWLRPLFQSVPREAFVPDGVWLEETDAHQRWIFLDRRQDTRAWANAVYAPHRPLITQLDDGRTPPTGPAAGDFTSSVSAPSVAVRMLRELNPHPACKVLEIGTGSGYNTALLAARCGPAHITSMEIDPQLADQARARLAQAGYHPAVIDGDGELGHPPGAPYDALISTASVYRIPPAWLHQLRPQGQLIAPLATPFGTDALLKLTADGSGGGAGRLVCALRFMRVRGQRRPEPWSTYGWPRLPGIAVAADGERQTITLTPETTSSVAPSGSRSVPPRRAVRSSKGD